MKLTESILEDEGMHVFEWWGGEYRPLKELVGWRIPTTERINC